MAAETIERTDAEADAAAEDERGKRLGRALDIAGIAAACVLGVILFDIVSGGKLTQWARARRGQDKPGGPCEGCGEDGPAGDD